MILAPRTPQAPEMLFKQPQSLSTVFSPLTKHRHHLEGAGPHPQTIQLSQTGVGPRNLHS